MSDKIKLKGIVRNDSGCIEHIVIYDPQTDQEMNMSPSGARNEEAKVCLQTKSGKTLEGTVNLCRARRLSDWFESVKTIRLYNAVHQGKTDKIIFIDKTSVDYCWPSDKR